MTCIVATREGMAADARCTDGSLRQKVFRVKWGLVGISGDLYYATKVLKWLKAGRKGKFPKPPESKEEEAANSGIDLIWLTEERRIFTFTDEGIESEVLSEFWAVGSGQSYALGAMEVNPDPVRAVEIAAKYDCYTFPPAIWVPLKQRGKHVTRR